MSLSIVDLGLVSFKESFQKQLQIHNLVQRGLSDNTLILCEHPHTITFPRQASINNILDKSLISHKEIDFIIGLNRGGDVTYHGPGQLVGYLIFDLKQLGRDLGWFLNKIEQSIIKALLEFNIEGCSKVGFRGVWINSKKIASVGIGVDKWVSMHGFALNVNTDLSFFNKIKPCGLDVQMTSMQECFNSPMNIESVKQAISDQFLLNFNIAKVKEALLV